MQYQGGKSRIAKPILDVINNALSRRQKQNLETDCRYNNKNNCSTERESNQSFVSLFCGSCSVESKVDCDIKILNDKHKYLIAMLIGVQQGYSLPKYISEEQYKYIKEHKDEDEILTGFVGFGCSFGGKFFQGYTRNKEQTNYALQSKKSLLKDMLGLQTATFTCLDYRDVEIPENANVYADPPYANTTSYSDEKFDTECFWEYMRKISADHIVFISEQQAPNDFVCIWEKPFTRTLDRNKQNQFKVVEKLFVHKNSKYAEYIGSDINA